MPSTQPFKKRERIKLSDLNPEYPDHVWVFWPSPTPAIWGNLLFIWSLHERTEEGETIPEAQWVDAQDAYLAAIAEIVLDTGESKIDLSTPERVQEAMADMTQDGELLRGIVADYIGRVLKRRQDAEKKAEARLARLSGSNGKNPAESESPIAIGEP